MTALAAVGPAQIVAIVADGQFLRGRPPREYVERMEQTWGSPQGSVEDVDPSIAAAAEDYLPSSAWFLEAVKAGA